MRDTQAEKEALVSAPELNAGLGTKLTLSNENGEYAVHVRIGEMNIGEMFENLIVPVLLAAGYSPTVVDEYLSR
jgi:hypothetical protein